MTNESKYDDIDTEALKCDICDHIVTNYAHDLFHFSGIISDKFSGHIHVCASCVRKMNIPIDLNFDIVNWDTNHNKGYHLVKNQEEYSSIDNVRAVEIITTGFIVAVMLVILSFVFDVKNKQYEKEIAHERRVEILTLGEKFFILDEMEEENR